MSSCPHCAKAECSTELNTLSRTSRQKEINTSMSNIVKIYLSERYFRTGLVIMLVQGCLCPIIPASRSFSFAASYPGQLQSRFRCADNVMSGQR